MSELFDYEECVKKKQDAFAVIGYAIRKQYPDEKIPPHLARIMATIIDDGFLDCVLENGRQLIRHNENRIWVLKREVDGYERRKHELDMQIQHMESWLASLREDAERYENDIAGETDPVLLGAKKAYHFMEQKTHDKTLSSKAFNSYLMMYKNRLDDEQQILTQSPKPEGRLPVL